MYFFEHYVNMLWIFEVLNIGVHKIDQGSDIQIVYIFDKTVHRR